MDIMILAGGRGTRLGDTGKQIPKALVQVAGKPLIQHVMDAFEPGDAHRIFILGGYKVAEMHRYFRDTWPYRIGKNGQLENVLSGHDFVILDTGYFTETGGRIRMAANAIRDLSNPFMITYCDGLCNVDMDKLERIHADTGSKITLTAVKPISRFGDLVLDGYAVTGFREKQQQISWINGGYMLMNHDAIPTTNTPLENHLRAASEAGSLAAHQHAGFWTCVDAERDIEAAEAWIKAGRP